MKNTRRKLFLILVGCLAAFSVIEIPTGFFKTKLFLLFARESSLVTDIEVFPNGYTAFCADGTTPLVLEVSIWDSDQNPVPYSRVHVQPNHFSVRMKPSCPITGRDGRVTITLFPQELSHTEQEIKPSNNEPRAEQNHSGVTQESSQEPFPEVSVSVDVSAWKASPARWEGKLVHPPVMLVHGFQDTSESMAPLKEFLAVKGLLVYSVDYDTNTDLTTMAGELEGAIDHMIRDLKARGIYAETTDIVAHSLGGLVTRYYTTEATYLQKRNVHKTVFVNVPHHGTPWAEAGAAYLDSPFLRELYPTSPLYTSIFPGSVNKGLNHSIQTANIALANDEVVPIPSAMLTAWGIDTMIYRIGEEPLSLDAVISNQISGGSRHRQLLFYTPVFEQIYKDLTNTLSYPQKRK